jgi:signal transduction histidine kinase
VSNAADINRPNVASFARHGALVAVFNQLIALALSYITDRPLLTTMVYSQSIGLSIWAFTDFGRFAFPRDPRTGWPRGWHALALTVGGTVFGYVLGTFIGDAYCQCSTWEAWSSAPRRAVAYIVLTLAASTLVSLFFYNRGREEFHRARLAEAEGEVSLSKLTLLQSQLEPHMLFNTLANLRVLIGVDPPRAQLMLDRLIAYLRATLSASRATLHPLSEEFARVDDYVQLMKVRMGERLLPRLELPEELAAQPVPPLVLQPLVENAIKHGLEPNVSGGKLIVSAARDRDQLVLRVRDTGVGLDTASGDGTRFGMQQVRERLATLYGDKATLELGSADDAEGGTMATVRVPLCATP